MRSLNSFRLVSVLLAVLAALILIYPLVALVLGSDLSQITTLLSDPRNQNAIYLSLLTASQAAAISLIIGYPLALWLSKSKSVFSIFIRALVLVPLVLPPVVSGLALLLAFGRGSLIEPILLSLDLRVVFTTSAVVLAQLFVSMPFVVLALEGAFRGSDFLEEETAATLGARPARVFFTVTLPRFMPATLLAFLLAFSRSLGEFGATLTFAGSLEGVSRTLPLRIYLLRESDLSAAVSLAVLMLILALVVVFIAYIAPVLRNKNLRSHPKALGDSSFRGER